MIIKILKCNNIIGFTYYPLLEIILGVFFIIASISLPIVFYFYNGFKLNQWDEWLFVFLFFVFFLLLGKSLTFQYLTIYKQNDNIYFFQNMRLPKTEFTEENDVSIIVKNNRIKDEDFFSLYIQTDKDLKVFYQTRSEKEATKILSAFNQIIKGVNNGK